MPSETGKQHRFMAANCTSAKMRKKTGMSKKVACDFMHADKGKHFEEDAPPGKPIKIDPHALMKACEAFDEEAYAEMQYPDEGIMYIANKKDGIEKAIIAYLSTTHMEETELDSHSRWVLDSGMNTHMESKFTEAMNNLAKKKIDEVGDPFASWQGVDLQRKHWNKHSMEIIDGAIKATASAKTAEDRIAILQKYADEVGVPYSVLYNEILQDTGDTYFDKDDYTKDVQFQRPTRESKIMDSYKKLIKKA